MAQTGNSCSNPHIINLVNGLSDENFNVTNLDSIVYIKISNVLDKVSLTINMDTSYNDFGVCNLDVLKNNCNNSIIANDYFTIFREAIDYTFFSSNEDTVLLKIKFCDFSIYSSNTIINFNLKIKTNQLNSLGGSCIPEYCDNLVLNASLEQFVLPTGPQNNGQSYSDHLCGWENISPQSYYQNPWYDDISCTPLLGQAICNSAGLTNSNSFSCGYPAQQNNYYFNQNTAYGGLAFGDNLTYTLPIGGGVWQPQGILRVELNPSLVNNTTYYVEANIAKKYSTYYGYRLDFDITANPNYISTQYPINTNTSLHSAGIDFDPNLEWTKINTIYTTPATGAEQFMFIGNLTKAPLNPMQTQFTNSLGCSSNSQASTYFFDNLVVKKFYADAGIENITLCEGEGYQVQPTTCPFQGAVYNWQPAIYFDNNALPNPTITIPNASGLTNLTCSLTVTIQMADGSYATTDPTYVNINIIQGASITLGGTTTVLPNGTATLNAAGGSNYVWTGSDGSSYTGSSINVGPLTQDVTYPVNALSNSGCSVTETITIIVTPMPQTCFNNPNYTTNVIVPDGTDAAGLINILGLPSGLSNYSISNTNLAIEGDLILDNNSEFNFYNCHFSCYNGARLYNQNANLLLRVCTLEACNNTLWKGILNERKISLDDCLVKDARDGLMIAPQTTNMVSSSSFINNYVGINIFGECTFENYHNTFENPDPLYPHWLGWSLPKSLCGMHISDAILIQIDEPPSANQLFTSFKNINCGVICYNTDLTVNNAYFENIYDQFNDANSVNGSGIYAEGTSAHKIEVLPLNGVNQATTFMSCNAGIYHKGLNSILMHLGMDQVKRGIIGEKPTFCSNIMEYNKINAILYGIEMKLIDDVELFVINHNQVFVNDKKAKGISVSAFDNSTSQGSNIKVQDNEVEVLDGSAGIEINSVFHPKVNMNKIYHSLLAPITQYSSWNGIRINNCFRADVSCNETFVGSGGGHTTFGADIYLSQSENTLLACNYTNGQSRVGIYLSSDNNASSIQTNEIGSHSIGLYLDNSCMIGPQPDGQLDSPHANKWNGNYSNTQFGGAAVVNTNIWSQGANPTLLMSLIEDNQFRVNPPSNTLPYWPENYPDNTFGTNWFESTPIPALEPCTGGYCPHLENDGGGGENPSMSLNSSIALDLIQTTGYPQETKWMLKKGLIRNLSLNDSLLNANDTLQVFYYSIDQENLKKLNLIADTVMAVKLHNQALIETMHANDSIMRDLGLAMGSLMPLLEDSIIQDSIQIIIDQFRQQYSLIAAVNESYGRMLINQRNSASQQSSSINAGITPANFNEYLERKVNEIYYNTYGQGIDTLSTNDLAMISYISHICPQAGGPSVYKARALYQLLNDTIVFNDSTVCHNAGYFRDSQELLMPELKEKNKQVAFNLFPNPANESLILLFQGNQEEGTINVYNAIGKHIIAFTISKDTQSKELDIITLAEGFYMITFTTANFKSQQSFIKIK